MPLRSKPAAIKPIRNRSGSVSYRITASIKGKQHKKVLLCLEDAQAIQTDWELERVHAAAALRPKITRLSALENGPSVARSELNSKSHTMASGTRPSLPTIEASAGSQLTLPWYERGFCDEPSWLWGLLLLQSNTPPEWIVHSSPYHAKAWAATDQS